MADSQTAKVPVATSVSLETGPGSGVSGLIFKTKVDPGFVRVAVPDKEMSEMVALLLNKAAEVGELHTPDEPPGKKTALPILASHIGVSPGRDRSEALIVFRVGSVDLVFAVDATALHKTCTHFLSQTVRVGPETSQ